MAAGTATARQAPKGFVSVRVGAQGLGVPMSRVRDVLASQRIMVVPRSPRAVAGALNLRGRIVTAIDLRMCLGMAAHPAPSRAMSVVVEEGGALYGLLVDHAGEALTPSPDLFERNPANLAAPWSDIADGVYRLADQLTPVLNVSRLIDGVRKEAA